MGSETATLDRVIDQARTLTTSEQKRLRDAVDRWLQEAAEADREREFLQRLVDAGLMAEVKPPLQLGEREDLDPVVVTGEPVSAAIIEDRR